MKNYTIDHNIYLMNHKNGDVLKVTVNKEDSVKNLQLYRQDGLGNYYLDKNSRLKKQDNLTTKEDIVKASKKIGGHNTHHIDKWHHQVVPIYNAQHQITGFKPKLALKHHARIQNAKRYLRHLDHHHAIYLSTTSRNTLLKPINYLKDAIYADRNKEMVLAHKIHKLSR
ncbi:hypothetical protein QFX17_07350 [Lactobacillus helveticus]|uniref:Uncharacterized protein n=1 Tax=Lactobacillus helveticus CIRM-BIA 104 TaxID=1226333 RepID=U6FAX4_LACHE|nr:hypothetical protein [Lactobacillus helveticus]KXN80547.1 hypothetical protein AY470_04095 [Lactobacillus helveticus]MCO0808335.1 hypothetical protein [Lactobacillus helveticus]MCP9317747.1 hypothetical protein [Lactobacillus helveticus]MCT0165756.1 hypothetical protein [Lactobacillus helveticus]MCT0193377.1 hypothetical protein [Lactobacillus helveticus]